MINTRKVATLGLGFGSLAIAAIGLIGDTQQYPVDVGGTGGGGYHRTAIYKGNKPANYEIPINIEYQDEEEAIVITLLECYRQGYL